MVKQNCRKIFALILSVMLVLSAMPLYGTAYAYEADDLEVSESITPKEPSVSGGVYQIGTAAELYWFAGLVNGTLDGVEQDASANAELTANINLNTGYTFSYDADTGLTVTDRNSETVQESAYSGVLNKWTPIGYYNSVVDYVTYTGTFDGQNYVISGLYINDSEANYQGLFGTVDGTVKKVILSNGYISAGTSVGGIASSVNGSGVISGCVNNITVRGSDSGVGGIVGSSQNEVVSCTNNGAVEGANVGVGGIVGHLHAGAYGDASVTSCTNNGTVVNTSQYTGGIVGYSESSSTSYSNTVSLCVNTGTVTGTKQYVGGIVGYAMYTAVTNCYNIADIAGYDKYIGGVTGYIGSSDVSSSYSYASVLAGDESTYYGSLFGFVNSTANVSNCYYLANDAGIKAAGISGGSVNYEGSSVTSKTIIQFASGEVCWLLNGRSSDDTVWYQNVDNGSEQDMYPLLSSGSAVVYQVNKYYCDGTSDKGYSNSTDDIYNDHSYDSNGFCTNTNADDEVCGCYQPAVLNSNGIYEISNAGQLFWFAALVNGDDTLADFDAQDTTAKAMLTNDIDLNPGYTLSYDDENGELTVTDSTGSVADASVLREWTPIATSLTGAYSGSFNGKQLTISGLYVSDEYTSESGAAYSGLFGCAQDATLSNVFISNSYISASAGNNSTYVGALAGYVSNCTIYQCDIDETTTCISNAYTGGLVGEIMSKANIYKCAVRANVISSTFAGGMIGTVVITDTVADSSSAVDIRCCYSASTVSAPVAGGIVGWVSNEAPSVRYCYYLDTGVSSANIYGVAKDSDAFASGEVTYLLCSLSSEEAATVWRQDIGEDVYPQFSGNTVCKISYNTKAIEDFTADDDYINYQATGTLAELPDGYVWIYDGAAYSTWTCTGEDITFTATNAMPLFDYDTVELTLANGETRTINLDEYVSNAASIGGVTYAKASSTGSSAVLNGSSLVVGPISTKTTVEVTVTSGYGSSAVLTFVISVAGQNNDDTADDTEADTDTDTAADSDSTDTSETPDTTDTNDTPAADTDSTDTSETPDITDTDDTPVADTDNSGTDSDADAGSDSDADTDTDTDSSAVVLMGDVDGNGTVNSVDSLLALRFGSAIIDLTGEQQFVADVDENGIVNSVDALYILRHSAGLNHGTVAGNYAEYTAE